MDWPCDDKKKTGIDWKWQAMDGVITKAPLGGKKAQDQIPHTDTVKTQVQNAVF